MTIDRLRDVLGAVGPRAPDALEMSELLWLACHLPTTGGEPERTGPAPVPPAAEPADAASPPPVPATPGPAPVPRPRAALHPRPARGAATAGGTAGGAAGGAVEVLVPTAPMLADPLGVQRALRPLKRRVPSRHRLELDEDATAARIADARMTGALNTGAHSVGARRWTPVLVPAPERWLTLTLVVDGGPTMRLWQPLARELAEALVRQGAFRDVHVGHLDVTGRVSSAAGAPPRDPGTLLDGSGRHAVLVLSDCSGPHWWDGRAARAVRRWAQAGPAAIVQPLPERLWRRTAAPASPGLAVLPRPGAANADLRFTPYDGAPPPGVPVPVLEVAPHWFAAWAHLVSGAGPQPAAVTTLPSRTPGGVPVLRERELPVAERVRRFLSTASAEAAELAAHVAVSDPSLPVMRLIQHRVLGGSGPGRLAEVLLSGLLRPAGGVRYAFVPGAREALLDTLPRPEAQHTRHVLEAVSAEIERRAGTAAETFRALLPADGGPVRLAADTDHFALVTAETGATLAPASSGPPHLLDLYGRQVDDLIGQGWDRPPQPTAIGEDEDGAAVWVDILPGGTPASHGLIIDASHDSRYRLLETIVLGLALNHSPGTVTFAFLDLDAPSPYYRFPLDTLPHTTDAIDGLPALGAERARRRSVLRAATWDAYQAAIAGGRDLAPLPALVVFVESVGRLPTTGREMDEIAAHLGQDDTDLGIRLVFLTSVRPDIPPARWEITFPGDGSALLKHEGRKRQTRFRPAETPYADMLALQGRMAHRWFASGEPQAPSCVIGLDEDGHEVELNPLDPSAGMPHGLVVGEQPVRQRVVRAVVSALTDAYPPSDLGIVFAGLGTHPLGVQFDLLHQRRSYEELLGDPKRLREFVGFLEELESRSRARPERRLLLVVDVSLTFSLTFPSSRPEVAEALLALAQRGESLGVHLLLSSTTVEESRTWNRFLPLLGWRVAANHLTPAELSQVVGQGALAFPDGRTAYLKTPGDGPRRFEVALSPSHEQEPPDPPEPPDLQTLTGLWWEVEDGPEPEWVRNILRGLLTVEEEILRGRRAAGSRHLVFHGPPEPEMRQTARRYGQMLADLGVLPNATVTDLSWQALAASGPGEALSSVSGMLRQAGGGVLLLYGVDALAPLMGTDEGEVLVERLIALVERHGRDTVVILSGERPGLEEILSADFRLGALFPRSVNLVPPPAVPESPGLPETLNVGDLPPVTGDRVPIGVEGLTRAPVLLDFTAEPHLLVIGHAGSGRANLIHLIIEGIVTRREGPPTVYVLDPDRYLRGIATEFGLNSPVPRGVHYTYYTAEFKRFLNRHLHQKRPTESFFISIDVASPDDDPLAQLPGLGALAQKDMHLIVARRPRLPGREPDPVVTAMHDFGAPALLLGRARGQEADRYGALIPDEEAPPGRGVFVRRGEQRPVQVAHASPPAGP
ncbi:hypothetical protein AGRA3207_005838 [Actinomadura graeca]|uniref:FtsK domain-containing protein n=1 Tax=Actinomadura graeca TaxID=2750812 RepID=A0ABX8R698_9ACTN|nr:SAV_2336 N-terminal domain-related protein [Actinomadura graeca]QXJ24503.1 hypothetical protein AGRA3207_005838 [Actinomadura graeca]